MVIEQLGWQWMFVIGALPALVLVPLMIKYLPESTAFLQSTAPRGGRGHRRTDGSRSRPRAGRRARVAKAPTRCRCCSRRSRRTTVAFWVTSFMGLLLVYGLNTWLPQIMREAGYELGAALALLLVLNVGAVVGLLVAGRVADKIGTRTAAIGWFAAAACSWRC